MMINIEIISYIMNIFIIPVFVFQWKIYKKILELEIKLNNHLKDEK